VRRRVKFKHDVDVAVGAVVTARARAEQGRVTDTARATPFRFLEAWRGFADGSFSYHSRKIGVCQSRPTPARTVDTKCSKPILDHHFNFCQHQRLPWSWS
jgi:hypothetical protein